MDCHYSSYPRSRETETDTAEEFSRLRALLNAKLLATSSATAVLEEWCQGPVVVRKVPGRCPPLDSKQKERLRISHESEVAYRRVELLYGRVVLSRADNWYRLDQLTDEMRAALQDTETPFGTIVRSLRPERHSFAISLLASPFLMEHRALLSINNCPLCEVHERYTEALIYSNQSG